MNVFGSFFFVQIIPCKYNKTKNKKSGKYASALFCYFAREYVYKKRGKGRGGRIGWTNARRTLSHIDTYNDDP